MTTTVTVIGYDGRPLAPEATAALASAQLVVGAPRHLKAAIPQGPQGPQGPQQPQQPEQMELKRLGDALDTIVASASSGPVVVLASGDPGFFGIVRALRARGLRPQVIPAVSSIALAFARLGLDWDDALVTSSHGRDPRQALAAALAHPKVAILTAPGTAREIGTELVAAGGMAQSELERRRSAAASAQATLKSRQADLKKWLDMANSTRRAG